jgi:hypothetical protein
LESSPVKDGKSLKPVIVSKEATHREPSFVD